MYSTCTPYTHVSVLYAEHLSLDFCELGRPSLCVYHDQIYLKGDVFPNCTASLGRHPRVIRIKLLAFQAVRIRQDLSTRLTCIAEGCGFQVTPVSSEKTPPVKTRVDIGRHMGKGLYINSLTGSEDLEQARLKFVSLNDFSASSQSPNNMISPTEGDVGKTRLHVA